MYNAGVEAAVWRHAEKQTFVAAVLRAIINHPIVFALTGL